ncbi:hypothetical protein Phum_PHUM544680 [Pediculus humanus corporis]|uniref:Uncharacterized protein n=1 Tax=Pediculus humanus subsp. corporis TaxID=121224 RepID=E0W039_PEDHC|nr:uncharacterized protein Phum_PHUM544680 [Pediculus humanus corporis]EEB18995.1 hypothetical protein Phum_PHUM544680 [Pediculus humanus corporis]
MPKNAIKRLQKLQTELESVISICDEANTCLNVEECHTFDFNNLKENSTPIFTTNNDISSLRDQKIDGKKKIDKTLVSPVSKVTVVKQNPTSHNLTTCATNTFYNTDNEFESIKNQSDFKCIDEFLEKLNSGLNFEQNSSPPPSCSSSSSTFVNNNNKIHKRKSEKLNENYKKENCFHAPPRNINELSEYKNVRRHVLKKKKSPIKARIIIMIMIISGFT